jgi:hypothetical protein
MALDSAPVDGPCGGITCREGQTCVSNACVYQGCTGSNVPGDYASVQAAVTALAPVGGTICLAAQGYNENVTIYPSMPLTIQGISASQSTVTSLSISTSANVTLKGMGTSQSLQASLTANAVLSIEDCIAASENGWAIELSGSEGTFNVTASKVSSSNGGGIFISNSGPLTVLIDGVDASSSDTNGDAISIEDSNNQSNVAFSVTVQNSYVHDSFEGIVYRNTGYYEIATQLAIDNNTFVNDGTALDVGPTQSGLGLSYFNDLFTKNQLGISITSEVSTPSFGDSLLFGNTTNYGGMAVDGMGYIKADPMLDTSVTPPALDAGSPARGAGDKSHAPADDYWGNPRGASVDIGAVQSS